MVESLGSSGDDATVDILDSQPDIDSAVSNEITRPDGLKIIHDYPGLFAQLISGSLAVLAYAAFLSNETGLRRWSLLRRNVLMKLPAKYEGYWASTCRRDSEDQVLSPQGEGRDDETARKEVVTFTRISISKIYFSKSRECWVHHGYEFDIDGQCLGEFKVESIYFSEQRGMWFFRGSTWRHEKSGQELYSERLGEHDQLSYISLAPKIENHIVSRYVDDPNSAGKWMHNSGRALMVRLRREDLDKWFPNFKGAIDHPSIRSGMKSVLLNIGTHLEERVSRSGQPAVDDHLSVE